MTNNVRQVSDHHFVDKNTMNATRISLSRGSKDQIICGKPVGMEIGLRAWVEGLPWKGDFYFQRGTEDKK